MVSNVVALPKGKRIDLFMVNPLTRPYWISGCQDFVKLSADRDAASVIAALLAHIHITTFLDFCEAITWVNPEQIQVWLMGVFPHLPPLSGQKIGRIRDQLVREGFLVKVIKDGGYNLPPTSYQRYYIRRLPSFPTPKPPLEVVKPDPEVLEPVELDIDRDDRIRKLGVRPAVIRSFFYRAALAQLQNGGEAVPVYKVKVHKKQNGHSQYSRKARERYANLLQELGYAETWNDNDDVLIIQITVPPRPQPR